jgi:hypothetical protein
MNKTLVPCRGTFFANGGIRIGALKFFDGETDAEAIVYYDKELTSPAPNPIPIDINGNIPQVFGDKFYKVYQYAIKPTGTNFPADYDFILDFFWDASTTSSDVGSLGFVDSVSALKALSPSNGDSIGLLGYYVKGDARFRVLTFNSTSIDTPNNGNRIRPNGYGAGNWEENSSSVIYASDFGLLNPSATVNGNLAQLVSWCNSQNVACVFDKGIYNITSGSAVFNNQTTIEDGVYFNATGGAFTLSLNGVFDIPQKSFGTTSFLLDVSASTHSLAGGIVPEVWGTSTLAKWALACERCGSSGLRIVGSKSIPDTSGTFTPNLSRFVFGKDGKLTFNNATGSIEISVTKIVIDGRSSETGLFDSANGLYIGKLNILTEAKTSWFENGGITDGGIATALSSSCTLFVNNDFTLSSDTTLGDVVAIGGVVTADSCVVTIGSFSGDKALKALGAGYFIGCSNAHSYVLDSEATINGFIRSNSRADFQGITTTGNIALPSSAKVFNMVHSGTISATYLEGYNCQFLGAITAQNTRLYNCSTVGATLSAVAGLVNHIWKNCINNGQVAITSLIADKIDKLIFETCLNISGSTPLVISGLLANSRQAGSIISVRNNTPECFADDAVPSGVWAQSYIDVQLTMIDDPAPASYSYDLLGKAWALKLPNIPFSSTRLHASSFSELAVSEAIGAKINTAFTVVFVGTSGALSDADPVRVSGNLY